jgi:hypothetical protein
MMRSVLKLSCVLLVTSLLACSSKSEDEGTGNSGGSNGSIIGGAGGRGSGGSSTSSGGSSTSSGGSSTSSGGSSASNGGSASSAGTTSTAGSSSGGSCNGASVSCLDSSTAQGCNPDTGMLETVDCVAELEPLGVVSSGCTMDATGEGCDISGFKDEACATGVGALISCRYVLEADAFDYYVGCFLHDKNQNGQDLHELITCVGTEITSAAPTTGDCTAATDTCVGSAVGAAGSGAGGAAQ